MTVRRTPVLVIGALIATIAPTWAQAARGHRTTPKSHSIRLTQTMTGGMFSGNPPYSGSNSGAGPSDGTIGTHAVHGRVVTRNRYTGHHAFTGKATVTDPQGTFRLSYRATFTGAPGSFVFSGAGHFSGGTGLYKGARGRFTFVASPVGAAVVRRLQGTITY